MGISDLACSFGVGWRVQTNGAAVTVPLLNFARFFEGSVAVAATVLERSRSTPGTVTLDRE